MAFTSHEDIIHHIFRKNYYLQLQDCLFEQLNMHIMRIHSLLTTTRI